jgi:hypothetical protein
MRHTLAVLVVAGALQLGCPGDSSQPPGHDAAAIGSDAQIEPDAGAPRDASLAGPDASTTPDVGAAFPDAEPVPEDSGLSPDVGASADASSLPDATSLPDASPAADVGADLDGGGAGLDAGGCNPPCIPGTFCHHGSCSPVRSCLDVSFVECPLPSGDLGMCCGGACVDVHSDPHNCSYCGDVCPPGTFCQGAYCVVPDGGTAIPCSAQNPCPAGYVCWDRMSGVCLPLACPSGDTGSGCAFGRSTTGWIEGVCCNGTCVDTWEDPANCGTCGKACASGTCTGGLCLPEVGSDCQPSCAKGWVCAGGECRPPQCGYLSLCTAADGQPGYCCNSSCVDVASDSKNCGGCYSQCPAGQTCDNGLCSGTQPPCGSGLVDGFCDISGGTSFLCCPGTGCVDLLTDHDNCGQCGRTCPSTQVCLPVGQGQCGTVTCNAQNEGSPCSTGSVIGTCCSSTCVDLTTDPSHCGRCTTACQGAETCKKGLCGVDVCTMPDSACHGPEGVFILGLCCSSPADGGAVLGCVNPYNDPTHCGSCAKACTGAASACCSSVCTDTSTDSKNCGYCFNPCPGSMTCMGSLCR